MQVFADGTVIDGEGIHRLPRPRSSRWSMRFARATRSGSRVIAAALRPISSRKRTLSFMKGRSGACGPTRFRTRAISRAAIIRSSTCATPWITCSASFRERRRRRRLSPRAQRPRRRPRGAPRSRSPRWNNVRARRGGTGCASRAMRVRSLLCAAASRLETGPR